MRTNVRGPRRGGAGRYSAGVARLCHARCGQFEQGARAAPAREGQPEGHADEQRAEAESQRRRDRRRQQHQAAPQAEHAEGEHRPLGEAEAEDLQRVVEVARRTIDSAWHMILPPLPSRVVATMARDRSQCATPPPRPVRISQSLVTMNGPKAIRNKALPA